MGRVQDVSESETTIERFPGIKSSTAHGFYDAQRRSKELNKQ